MKTDSSFKSIVIPLKIVSFYDMDKIETRETDIYFKGNSIFLSG
jgi:hypothetical protein